MPACYAYINSSNCVNLLAATTMEETTILEQATETDETPPIRSPLQQILGFLALIILPILLGIYFAPRLIPQPKIGLIRLNNDITSQTAFQIGEQLAYARNQPNVKGVVLILNSPGGSAAYSEELYLDVWNSRQQLPIVASVDLLAASGAYYMAAAADEIYAKPTSGIGSIGVVAFLPDEELVIDDELITTGPFKSFGGTRDGFIRQMEISKYAFLDAVQQGRGDRLQVDADFLSRAEVWSGSQALDMGLIDGLFSTNEAIKRAGDLAGIRNYEVVELFPLAFDESGDGQTAFYHPPAVDIDALWLLPQQMPAGIYYRYLPDPAVP